MQFYPPGFAPFTDSISCNNTHWCASLHINDLECTLGFAQCNNNCIEPTNFGFIQTNGVPTGPPSPQLATAASFTPNAHTLLMNPGDRLKIHIFDAKLRGGGHALETSIHDLTTGKSGFMIASARNGFMATSFADCSGHPFSYRPEYDTAKPQNIIPWAALETNISTIAQNGDLDCDGTSNWPNWPSKLRPGPYPSPFLQEQPQTRGHAYPTIQFQTNPPASESTCAPTGVGCAVPPPSGPGHFYPWWTQARVDGKCVWEFGQMTNGNTFGRTSQYGGPSAYFLGNLEGPMRANPTCST